MPWFDCAVRRPISTNTGGVLGPNLGLILHHAVMNGSLFNFFNNAANQVSAHFWVARNGTIEQYVDTSVVAWHGRSLNPRYVGVETEGCTTPPYAEPMTPEMVDGLSRIYAEGNRRHGWVNALANSDGERGFGFHRMAVNTACPCDTRLSMRPQILSKAFGGTPTPEPEPEPEEEESMVQFQFGNDQYISNNLTYRWILNEWDLNAVLISQPNIKMLGAVNGLAGFGVPGDPATANRAGVPWPAVGPS